MMVEPADLGDLDHITEVAGLDRPRDRRIHFQREVRSPTVIVAKVIADEPSQVMLAEYDDVIEKLASNRSDEPFDIRVLPRAPW